MENQTSPVDSGISRGVEHALSPVTAPHTAIQRLVNQRPAAFMSPTDRMVSPCSRKLISRKGPHHPFAMHQRKLLPQPHGERTESDEKENVVHSGAEYKSANH